MTRLYEKNRVPKKFIRSYCKKHLRKTGFCFPIPDNEECQKCIKDLQRKQEGSKDFEEVFNIKPEDIIRSID